MLRGMERYRAFLLPGVAALVLLAYYGWRSLSSSTAPASTAEPADAKATAAPATSPTPADAKAPRPEPLSPRGEP